MDNTGALMRSTKRRVFYAEDHEDTRQLLKHLLGQSNYEVCSAATIKDGLRLVRDQRFDLYLLSGRFEDGSGVEMCRHIRQLDPSTPIIFYSAAAHEADKMSGINAGAQAYIAKPGNIFELVNTITQLINQQERAGHG